MTPVATRLQAHAAEIVGTLITTGTGVTVWQVQLEWGLRILLSIVGLITGLLTIRSLLKKDRLN